MFENRVYDGRVLEQIENTVEKVLRMPRAVSRVWKGIVHHDGYGFGRRDSRALVRIYSDGIRAVVVLTELKENDGTSVTNCYERIATLLRTAITQFIPLENFPSQVTWIEQYEERPRELTLVALQWDGRMFSRPQWRAMTEADAAKCGVGGVELATVPRY